MSLIDSIHSWLKENSIPIIFIIGALYLFFIDIIVVFLLGYQPKDISYLVDVERIIFFNTVIITVFTILYWMIKKRLVSTFTIIVLSSVAYALYFNQEADKYLDVILFIIGFITLLAFNIYKTMIEAWYDDSLWKLSIANVIIGFLLTAFIVIFINNNISKWDNIIKNDTKLQFDKTTNPFLIINAKSFNPVYLQELNQDLKLFVNPTFAKRNFNQFDTKDDENKDFVLIPHNDKLINYTLVTTYYYNVEDIKNIFILNPSTCNKNGECELQTLITKAINKNDTSKGYRLISNYKHIVKIRD
jgi:hypothetical protein